MKVHELLNEGAKPELVELVKRLGLKMNSVGTKIDDFSFSKEHEDAFKQIGYQLRWNGKKFDVISDESMAKAAKQADDDFAIRNITHHASNFVPRRKMK